MGSNKYQMGYLTLTSYIILIIVLVSVVVYQKLCGKKPRVVEVEMYEQEYILPDDVDTIYINQASVLELKRFGFTNYEIVSILSSRERGFVFRELEQLKSYRYFDTLKLNALSPYIKYDSDVPLRKRDERQYVTKERATWDPKISLYYTSNEDMLRQGISQSVIDTISRYKELYYIKGSVALSRLKSANSLTIRDILAEHIVGTKHNKQSISRTIQKVDINSATKEELMKLPWIKEKTATMIINYRNKLGGYVDIAQLKELYGMDSLRYVNVSRNLYVDETKVKKIHINRKLRKEFYHPYISYDLKQILNMNRAFNKISSIEEFRELYEGKYDNKLLEKYLSFEK